MSDTPRRVSDPWQDFAASVGILGGVGLETLLKLRTMQGDYKPDAHADAPGAAPEPVLASEAYNTRVSTASPRDGIDEPVTEAQLDSLEEQARLAVAKELEVSIRPPLTAPLVSNRRRHPSVAANRISGGIQKGPILISRIHATHMMAVEEHPPAPPASRLGG